MTTLEEACSLYGLAGVHEAAGIFPMMAEDEMAGLKASAEERGWLEPVVITMDGYLLDGRNRLIASVEIGKDVPMERRTVSDPVAYVVDANLHRRSLSPRQRAVAAGRATVLWEQARAAARERMATAGASAAPGRSAAENGVVPGPPLSEGKARDEIAEQFDISPSTAGRIAVVAEEPDLLDDVEKGRKGVRPAAEEALARKRQREEAGAEEKPAPNKITVQLLDYKGNTYPYAAPAGKATLNTTNDSVDWARFTWNPVTGCLHGCGYCYAREIANMPRMADSYPAGFTPLFHPERLLAPKNTAIPEKAADQPQFGRVFVCSMADLFGEWVPEEWIAQVFAACNDAPAWEYLFLTKFPKRYRRIDLPPAMWAGASVDTQKRVAGTEAAMRELDVKVRWLSVEPLLEPLTFDDLSWCDLMVIGAQSATTQPEGPVPAFAPPFRWVADLVRQADEAGVPVYLKANLLGRTNGHMPGMDLPRDLPRSRP